MTERSPAAVFFHWGTSEKGGEERRVASLILQCAKELQKSISYLLVTLHMYIHILLLRATTEYTVSCMPTFSVDSPKF